MTTTKPPAVNIGELRRLVAGWNGRFFYDEERGDIAYIAAACDAKQCDCEVKRNSDGDQDCSESLYDIDDAPADVVKITNALGPLLDEIERLRAVRDAAEAWCNMEHGRDAGRLMTRLEAAIDRARGGAR